MPQGFIRPTVHQLQELNRELDVAKSAWAQFNLRVDLGIIDVFSYTLTHSLSRFNKAVAPGRGPYLRSESRDVRLPKHHVARYRPCLEQGLKLPALCPSLIVGNVRIESSNQCAALSLWSQIRIDLPKHWLFGVAIDCAHHSSSQSGRNVECLGVVFVLPD